jgi:hypothetical protein
MESRLRPLAALALGSLLSSPTHAVWPDGCDDLSGLPIQFNVDWQTQIKPILNDTVSSQGRCTSCHSSGQLDGNLDLTDEGIDAIHKIVGTYVRPGNPLGSELFEKVNCAQPPRGGTRMPAAAEGVAGVPLSLDQQGLIYECIALGALGDPADEPPIPRDFLFRDGIESLR